MLSIHLTESYAACSSYYSAALLLQGLAYLLLATDYSFDFHAIAFELLGTVSVTLNACEVGEAAPVAVKTFS
ncbi:hypothetical protein A2U01_0050035 [Trifolium medium]|nr:hypothetical protein [Trifolium medium]